MFLGDSPLALALGDSPPPSGSQLSFGACFGVWISAGAVDGSTVATAGSVLWATRGSAGGWFLCVDVFCSAATTGVTFCLVMRLLGQVDLQRGLRVVLSFESLTRSGCDAPLGGSGGVVYCSQSVRQLVCYEVVLSGET